MWLCITFTVMLTLPASEPPHIDGRGPSPRGKCEDAVYRDAVDVLQIQKWKATGRKRGLEEGDRGGHGPKTEPSATQEEE
jgi:hypothetical protein